MGGERYEQVLPVVEQFLKLDEGQREKFMVILEESHGLYWCQPCGWWEQGKKCEHPK